MTTAAAPKVLTARSVDVPGKIGMATWRWVCTQGTSVSSYDPCASGCSGHWTELEARLHWRQHVASKTAYGLKWVYATQPCEVCRSWTDLHVLVPWYDVTWTLCRDHQTPAAVESVFEQHALQNRWLGMPDVEVT